jgi:ribosomal protein L11 methyltransferase
LHIPHPLYAATLSFDKKLSGKEAEEISNLLEDLVSAVLLHNNEATDGDDWAVKLTTQGPPKIKDIAARLQESGFSFKEENISVEKLPEQDWLLQVHQNFPPVMIGDFFVYGSHYEGNIPEGMIPLRIDAATAFGSGEHETTKGCLLALQNLKKDQNVKPRNALDMGCGSGILAIAMKKLWPEIRVTAIDIDPESIIVTNRHAEMNGVSDIITQAGDGYHAPRVKNGAPYDIVTANILAGPLMEMAEDLSRVLADGGIAILSGLLTRQKEEIIKAHEVYGFTTHAAQELGAWQVLVLMRKR